MGWLKSGVCRGFGCWCLWFLVPGFCYSVVCGSSCEVVVEGFPACELVCIGVAVVCDLHIGMLGGGMVAKNEGGGPGGSFAEVVVC